MTKQTLAQALSEAIADKAALLTINEAAEIARAHRRTITRWIALGRLPAAKTHAGKSGKVLIPKSELLALLAGVAKPNEHRALARARAGSSRLPWYSLTGQVYNPRSSRQAAFRRALPMLFDICIGSPLVKSTADPAGMAGKSGP